MSELLRFTAAGADGPPLFIFDDGRSGAYEVPLMLDGRGRYCDYLGRPEPDLSTGTTLRPGDVLVVW